MYTTFLYLWDNFWFYTIWYRRSVAALIFCGRLTESDVIVMPSVTCMDWLRWWYYHATHVLPILQHWFFLPTWVTNINLHALMQSKWKISEGKQYGSEIRRNKPIWKAWMNCWHMPWCKTHL